MWFGERVNARAIVDGMRHRTIHLESAISRFSDALGAHAVPQFWDHPPGFRAVLLRRVVDRLRDPSRIRGFTENVVDLLLHLSLPCSIDSMLHFTVFAVLMEEYLRLAGQPAERYPADAPTTPNLDSSLRLALDGDHA